MFYVYHGVFSVCLQNLIWTCSIVLLSKWVLYNNSSGPYISHSYSSIGLTRASKSLFLIVIVVVSESEEQSFHYRENFISFFAKDVFCVGIATR